jgi:ribosomal protein S18 acetylase RimI-like enzyme
MSFELRLATVSDADFLYECLGELRGGVQYPRERFTDYLRRNRLLEHADFQLLVGVDAGTAVGMLTCNRFAMPRYLGFGIEIEEVVVHPAAQRRGYGRRLLEALFERVKADPEIRKVVVKTDDQLRAGRLYEQYFGVVKTTVYGQTVNLL